MENNIKNFSRNKFIKKKSDKKSSNHPHLPALILAIILIAGLFFAYKTMQSDTSALSSLPYEVIFPLKRVTGKILAYDSKETPIEHDKVFVLYQNISDADKNVYNFFLDLVEHRTDKNYESAIVMPKETLREFGEDRLIYDIYYAMCYDHPEYFFLFSDTTVINCSTLEYTNYVTYFFTMEVVDPIENEQLIEFEKATTDFLKDIDLNGSDEEIELAIHDKLIDTVTYDDAILDITDNSWDLGHTAYGALVRDSDGRPNHAVCAGYSFAFEYLLHEAGIPCGYIPGSAESRPPSEHDTSTHAWNIVQVSGKWYEVDSTWDDVDYDISEDPYFYNALMADKEKYFNVRHHFYNRTTAQMKDLKATDDTLFYIDGYSPYNAVYDTSHTRANFSGTAEAEFDTFIGSLYPIAE